jgi:hypothetical protein
VLAIWLAPPVLLAIGVPMVLRFARDSSPSAGRKASGVIHSGDSQILNNFGGLPQSAAGGYGRCGRQFWSGCTARRASDLDRPHAALLPEGRGALQREARVLCTVLKPPLTR